MRRSLGFLLASPTGCFRPHLHQDPCVVCRAAESTLSSSSVAAPSSAQSAARPIKTIEPSSSPRGTSVSRGRVTDVASSRSLIDERREALLFWMAHFSSTPSASNSTATSDATGAIKTADEFEAQYKAYLTTDDTAARESMYNVLVTALDGQCVRNQRSSDTEVDNKAALAAECEQMVRLPKQLVLPHPVSSGGASTPVTAACPLHQSRAGDECSNQFESLVRSRFPANEEMAQKQLRFQDALLAMQRVLEDVQIPFFLACGTALGARRDGCFIPHDEDIDLGILYADISKPTAPHSSSSSPLAAAQDAVYQLLHSLAASGVFLTFDVCGAVDKGLEVRALHTPSNTRIDLNVYYPPVPSSDDELVRTGGPFLWASSFYEAAAARCHGMYRYRHKPFETELVTVPFCAKAVGDSGFRVPPERYLEENYGAGWRVPKQYSYTEGLTNEFKNIIEE